MLTHLVGSCPSVPSICTKVIYNEKLQEKPLVSTSLQQNATRKGLVFCFVSVTLTPELINTFAMKVLEPICFNQIP